ncbi:MAG: cupin-like domain-containing protein [Polyangiaceae bacterium]
MTHWREPTPPPALGRLRRSALGSESDFERDHLRGGEPVLLDGVYRGQPIEALRSLDALETRFGDMPIEICDEYFARYQTTKQFYGAPREETTVAAWLAGLEQSSSRRMVIELDMPESFQALFELPAHVGYRYWEPDGIRALLFLGNRGNAAHMHFDTDFNHVLFHQVIGQKRLVLLPPRVGPLLQPIANASAYCFERMREADQRGLLAGLGAVEVLLEPGDTVYIPPLWWHYLEYTDVGLSFALRFGRGDVGRFFASSFHPSFQLQNLASLLVPHDEPTGDLARVLDELRAAACQQVRHPLDKFYTVQRIAREAYDRLCVGAPAQDTAHGHEDWLEAVVREGISRGLYYNVVGNERAA